MTYWIIIFLGIISLTLSLSNPAYKLSIEKFYKINFLTNLFIRILFFLIGILLVFFGLYLESTY